MSWRGAVIVTFFSLFLVSCGKNDPVRPGSVPVAPTQAPAPPNYNYGGGGFGPGGGYGGNYSPGQFFPQQPIGNFRPQMPQGRPPQFYPFVPLDNYMRQDPRMVPYWNQMWGRWQQYAQFNRMNQYDFGAFWFDFCPNQWAGTAWADVYNYLDSNFYYWTQPGIQFYTGGSTTPEYFWQNANGFPMPQYNLCDWGC